MNMESYNNSTESCILITEEECDQTFSEHPVIVISSDYSSDEDNSGEDDELPLPPWPKCDVSHYSDGGELPSPPWSLLGLPRPMQHESGEDSQCSPSAPRSEPRGDTQGHQRSMSGEDEEEVLPLPPWPHCEKSHYSGDEDLPSPPWSLLGTPRNKEVEEITEPEDQDTEEAGDGSPPLPNQTRFGRLVKKPTFYHEEFEAKPRRRRHHKK